MSPQPAIRRNRLGMISLITSIGGMAVMYCAIRTGYLVHPAWRIVEAGFDAATVGGVADWFAVTALFRDIRIPLIRRHTNIIVRKRHQLAEGAVDLVSNKWLTPETIESYISRLAIVDGLVRVLEAAENRKLVLNLLREVLLRFSRDLDQPAFVTLLEKAVRREMQVWDIGPVIGRGLQRLHDEGGFDEVLFLGGAGLVRTLQQPQTLAEFEAMLRERLPEAIRERHPFAGMAVLRSLEVVGMVDYPKLAQWMARELSKQITEIASTPDNPMRLRLRDSLKRTADGLVAGDPESGQAVRQLAARLVNNTDLTTAIRTMLGRLKSLAIDDLTGDASAIQRILEDQLDGLLSELRSNPELRGQLNAWLTTTLASLIRNHHSAIAEMTRASLDPARLPDKELVAQIEGKVGEDLQYIRLNGAIVGGIIGMLIATIRLLLT
jgi:uncharacterized membrane-anchored protein YjiN (DUF445 family)